jgi:putative endonuclease
MMASQLRGTLYVGVTSDLPVRVWQHKNNIFQGFSQRYQVHHLVWFQVSDSMESAILREKQLKAGSRQKKIDLIEATNPCWDDLYSDIL